jgi:hypothetical protein
LYEKACKIGQAAELTRRPLFDERCASSRLAGHFL